MQHSNRSVYLERTPLFVFFETIYFFIFDKEYISVNTKSKNTEKQQCVHLGVRDSASTNLLFSEITLISLLTNQNLITVDSERTVQNSFGYLKCSNPNKKHHQMQMLILNQLRLKTWLFSNTVSSNNGVFKGKVFKQKRDNTTNWKSHQENFDSQTKLRLTKPNNNMQSLDYITRYCVYFVLLEVT